MEGTAAPFMLKPSSDTTKGNPARLGEALLIGRKRKEEFF